MPKLRDALKQTSGVDIGGNEFTLQETDIQPYIDNPDMAQMEADVTQARYGKTPVDDLPSGPTSSAGPPDKKGMVDFSRRGDFEKAVFKQLASETIPEGNPFSFNPNAALNAVSKQDLPELFSQVFAGEVAWQDRHLLDDDQKKYWMSEVKRYRAHVQTALEQERETAINTYNQMMNQFDRAAKEAEALQKQKRQRSKDIIEIKTKQRERQEKRQKGYQAELKRRGELLTKERELAQSIMDAEANKTLTDEEAGAFIQELQGIRDERKVIEAELQSRQMPKPKGGISKVEGKEAPAGSAKDYKTEIGKGGKTVVRKKMPASDKASGKTIVRTGTVKSGPNKGRKKVVYSDGSTAYADKLK